jgi:hypothetical protein
MSTVIRKKLNLALRSEKIDGERVYQIWRSAGQSAGKPPALDGAILHAPPQTTQLDIALHLLPVDAPDQHFIDYGVVIVGPVRWRLPLFDAVLRVLLAEYEGHRVSPSLLGSSSLRRISASRSSTPSAMISAYIRRNSRPIAAMVLGGSTGSDLLSLLSLKRLNALVGLRTLGRAHHRAGFSTDSPREFKMRRQRNPQGKRSNVGIKQSNRVSYLASIPKHQGQWLRDAPTQVVIPPSEFASGRLIYPFPRAQVQ